MFNFGAQTAKPRHSDLFRFVPCKLLCRYIKNGVKLAIVASLCVVLVVRYVRGTSNQSFHTYTGKSLKEETTNIIMPTMHREGQLKITPYDFVTSPMASQFKVTRVDCKKIIKGDKKEIGKAEVLTKRNVSVPRDDFGYYMELRTGCSKFIYNQGYITTPLTKEERDFPLAMSVVFHKHFHQVEELFRLIYRPQNYYCFHVDLKARSHVFEAARVLADCFDNVVIATDRVLIDLNHRYNLITPEMICLYELLKFKKWKYFINLTGQEFPIKTNRQMVKIFQSFRGQNDIKVLEMRHQVGVFAMRFSNTRLPPHGIRILRGESHIVASRAFVEFVTSDARVRDLVTYLNGTHAPEEAFWASVNADPKLRAPGGFRGSMADAMKKPWFGRVKWREKNGLKPCSGVYARGFCVFGVNDLQHIVNDDAIVANKFNANKQPLARMCMREWMYNRTRDEYLHKYRFITDRYVRG